MSGGGKGGPSADSDAKGPRYSGGASTGNKGGRPAWSKDVMYEDVEMGRLNVARAPDSVFLRQINELKANLTPATDPTTGNYTTVSISYDPAGRLVVTTNLYSSQGTLITSTPATVDSPLTNLAMFENLVKTGNLLGTASAVGTPLEGTTLADGKIEASDLLIAAKFLGAAADKTQSVLEHTVLNMDTIMGLTASQTSLTYDRASAFDATVLSTVFKDAASTGTGTDGFAKAADDARAVIQYYHDN